MNRIVVILSIFCLYSHQIKGDECCLSQRHLKTVEFTYNSKCEADNNNKNKSTVENIRYACKENKTVIFEYETLTKYEQIRAVNVSKLEIELFKFAWSMKYSLSLKKLRAGSRLDIKSFYASNNHFVNIPSEIFNYISNISEIDFSFNRLNSLNSSSFEASDFIEDTIQLVSINCSSNEISKVDRGTFSKLLLLENLDLSNNKIDQIDDTIFENNKAIRNVNFKNNPLKKFVFNIFAPDVNLNQMHLPNSIEELDVSCVKRKCHFRGFGADENLTNLQHFNASGNSLENITDLLKKLGMNLKTLDLSWNVVEKLENSMLDNFTQLKDLRLSHTKLNDIANDTFYYQTKLITLDLSYNELHSAAFATVFKHLKWLNLEENYLTKIDDVNPKKFPTLETLGISKYKFYCAYLDRIVTKWKTKSLTLYSTSGQYIGCNPDEVNVTTNLDPEVKDVANNLDHEVKDVTTKLSLEMKGVTTSQPHTNSLSKTTFIASVTVGGILCITIVAVIILLIFRRRSTYGINYKNVTPKYVQTPQIQFNKNGYGDEADYEDIEPTSNIYRPISINFPKDAQNDSSYTATASAYATPPTYATVLK